MRLTEVRLAVRDNTEWGDWHEAWLVGEPAIAPFTWSRPLFSPVKVTSTCETGPGTTSQKEMKLRSFEQLLGVRPWAQRFRFGAVNLLAQAGRLL